MKTMNLHRIIMKLYIFLLIFVIVLNPVCAKFKIKYFLKLFNFFQEALLSTQIAAAQVRTEINFLCQNKLPSKAFSIHIEQPNSFSQLNSSLPLAFVLHGWQDGGSSDWLDEVRETWLTHKAINVCTVDWGLFAMLNYKISMLSIFDVGVTLANIIFILNDFGFTPNNITLVGYSLGAHAAGYAGKQLNGEIYEIIGLDPAGPLFTMPTEVNKNYRLDETDAKFVQVMHTSGGTLGTHVKSGHADFYPNGGISPQTNCVFTTFTNEPNMNPVGCSHSMVVRYFKLSMNPDYPFIGWNCPNYRLFIFGLCYNNEQAKFGIHSERQPGNYFLTTDIKAPYVSKRLNIIL